MGLIDANDVAQAPPFGAHPQAPRRTPASGVIYTTGAAAKLCGISQQTVIRCFDTGRLKGFRVPGSKFRRIPRAALLSFMLENGVPTDSLGELSADERAEVARVVGEPQVVQATLKLTTADRLEGVA